MMPALSSCSAKLAFSLRKPYLKARLLTLGGRRVNSTQDVRPASGIMLQLFTPTKSTYLRSALVANLDYLIYPQLPELFIDSHGGGRGHAHNSRKTERGLYSMLHLPSTIINVMPRDFTMPYHLYMKRIRINFAVNSHRANTELFRSAYDTTGNFSSRTQ